MLAGHDFALAFLPSCGPHSWYENCLLDRFGSFLTQLVIGEEANLRIVTLSIEKPCMTFDGE
jgi:hypothetical protein